MLKLDLIAIFWILRRTPYKWKLECHNIEYQIHIWQHRFLKSEEHIGIMKSYHINHWHAKNRDVTEGTNSCITLALRKQTLNKILKRLMDVLFLKKRIAIFLSGKDRQVPLPHNVWFKDVIHVGLYIGYYTRILVSKS